MSRGIATQDHVWHCLRGSATLHKRLGHGLQRYLQQRRCRQGSGQAESPQQRSCGSHQGKRPDHSRQLDDPHRGIQPPWPVIDPVEQGHVWTHDEAVRHERPAHDHHAEPGGGHQYTGPSALVHPAIRGPEPPPGQPPAQLPRPAGRARACRRSCFPTHPGHAAPRPHSVRPSVRRTKSTSVDRGWNESALPTVSLSTGDVPGVKLNR